MLTWWSSAAAGVGGSLLYDVAQLAYRMEAVKTFPWRMPREAPLRIYLATCFLRAVCGGGAACLLWSTGQISGFVGAAGSGMAGVVVIQGLGRRFRDQAGEEKP